MVLRALLLLLWLAFPFAVNGQDSNSKDDFHIEKSAKMSAFAGNQYTILDIGELEPGKHGTIKIQIENDLGREFEAGEIDASCGCLQAKTSPKPVLAGESLPLEATLTVPKQSAVPVMMYSIVVTDRLDQVRLQFIVRFSFRGLVSFTTQNYSYAVEMGKTDFRFSIPMVITEPIQTADLQVWSTEGLGPMEFSIESQPQSTEEPKWELVCHAKKLEVSKFGRAGTIFVRDVVSGLANQIDCYLNAVSAITIAPSTLRLVEKEGKTVGNLICRIEAKEFLPKADEEPQFQHVQFTANFAEPDSDHWSIAIESQHVNAGSYRLGFHVKPRGEDTVEYPTYPKTLQLQVSTPNKLHEITVPCLFIGSLP